jgi:DNA-binding transcriptional LysR family regulator
MDRLAAMETFVRIVEAGSFSAAARALNVGQPAVSKTVAHLEEHWRAAADALDASAVANRGGAELL